MLDEVGDHKAGRESRVPLISHQLHIIRANIGSKELHVHLPYIWRMKQSRCESSVMSGQAVVNRLS